MAQTEQGTTTQQRNQQLERGEAAQRKADIRLQKGFLQSCWLNRPGEAQILQARAAISTSTLT